jgi:hypothetical protein
MYLLFYIKLPACDVHFYPTDEKFRDNTAEPAERDFRGTGSFLTYALTLTGSLPQPVESGFEGTVSFLT